MRMLEIRTQRCKCRVKGRGLVCTWAESTRGDVHTDGKARAGGRGQCRRASWERWLLGGRGGGGWQQAQGSVQREAGVVTGGSATGG